MPVCKNCNLSVPDGTEICPRCGYPFEENTVLENFSKESAEKEIAFVPKKKNIPAIILGILLAAAVAGLIYMINQYNLLFEENTANLGTIRDNKTRIGSLERDVDAKNREISDLREKTASDSEIISGLSEEADYHSKLMETLASEESWGYATENFHVDKGVMVIDRFGGMHELKLYSTYYTTFTFEVSDTSVCIAKWSDDEWINKDTTVYITPVSAGFATLTFTNELYDTSFKVLVVVE